MSTVARVAKVVIPRIQNLRVLAVYIYSISIELFSPQKIASQQSIALTIPKFSMLLVSGWFSCLLNTDGVSDETRTEAFLPILAWLDQIQPTLPQHVCAALYSDYYYQRVSAKFRQISLRNCQTCIKFLAEVGSGVVGVN